MHDQAGSMSAEMLISAVGVGSNLKQLVDPIWQVGWPLAFSTRNGTLIEDKST
jgi:hypothetical protein